MPAQHGRACFDERVDRHQWTPLGPDRLSSHGTENRALRDPHGGRRAGAGDGLDHPEHRSAPGRRAGRTHRARAHRSRRIAAGRRGTPDALARHAEALLGATGAQAMVCLHNGKIVHHGPIERAIAEAIACSLPADALDLLARDHTDEWPEALQPLLGKWVGMLALPFDPPGGGWCLLLRTEQIEHVSWAGRPERASNSGRWARA
nr:hypothetical protein [Massilia sp. Dwa41.01b]